MLVGNLAAIPRVPNRARQLCEFDVRLNQLNNRVSDLDRRFIVSSIASNMLAIESLNYALGQVQNEEWRGLIQMMIAQHTHDLNMAIRIAKRIGADTTPNLRNIRVYPGTPDYDLGMRRVDLVAKFLDPLMSAGVVMTPTVTAIPTDLTGTPTTGVTDVPTMTATAEPLTPSPTSTVDLTGTATWTATAETMTPSATSTADLTGTATWTATAGTPSPSATSTLGVTSTVTAVSPTETSTPFATPTAIAPFPTIPGGPTANFDLVALMIIEDEHVMSIETALAAERLVRNDEIRAFAKHTADMAKLHLLLINDLQYRMLGLTILPPPPSFQRDYQGPRRFGPDGDD